MPIPLQIQLFDAFLGSQEAIHSIILPEIFSSGGSQNVFIDKYARVVEINGYTKQNSSAHTTNTGGSTALVRALIPYRGTAGGSITRKLLYVLDDSSDEWEIWVSSDNGATGTFLEDEGSGSVGYPADWAQFGDKLYICNGQVAPRVYDGSTIAAVGLTQSPAITPAVSSNSGNLLGNYTYKLVSTIAGARQAGSAPSSSILLNSEQCDLTWTADTDTNVDGYEIYRTTGTGTLYYYLTTIDGRTTASYTDNISDVELLERRILEEHGDNPPTAYFCEPHRQRMWWIRTDTNPTRGYWSDPGEPESVYAQNYLDFSDSETVGDVCTGAIGNYEGLIVMGTEKAIWTVSGTGAVIGDIVDYTKTRTNAQTGWVSSHSVVRIPAGSRYTDQEGKPQLTSVATLAYFTPLGDIRIFDGDNDLIVSHPLRDTIKTFNYTQRAKIHAIIDSEHDQAIWFVPTGSAGECDQCFVWNYRYGVWYVWPTMPFAGAVELDTSTDAALLLVGQGDISTGGFIYAFLDGNDFDGGNIEAIWMTKTLYGVNDQGQPAFSHTKRFRWLDILFRIDQNTTITVDWLNGTAPDNAGAVGTDTVTPAAAELISADGNTVISADGSTLVAAIASAQARIRLRDSSNRLLHDEGVRLRIKTNTTTAPWALEAMQLAYQVLPGLRRRNQ